MILQVFNRIKALRKKNLLILFHVVLCLASCSTWDTDSRIIIENKTELDLKNINIKFCKDEQFISLGPLEKSKPISITCSGENVSLFAKVMQPGPLPFYLEITEVGNGVKVYQSRSDLSNQINYDELNHIQILLIEEDAFINHDSVNQKVEFKFVSNR